MLNGDIYNQTYYLNDFPPYAEVNNDKKFVSSKI